MNVGTRHILSVVAYDSKGRFNIAGHPDDPLRDFIDTNLWPSWICAWHGHNAKIQSQLEDADLATCWCTNDDRSELGDTVTYQGRPFLAKDEFPPRLYHRTTMQRLCFSILENGFQAGYGRSGKFHNYFTCEPSH